MRKLLVLIMVSFWINSYSQNDVFFNDYRSYKNIKSGTYHQRSTSKEFSNLTLPVVENNSKSIETNTGLDFIKIHESPVILFDGHDIEKMKPIGKIEKTIQVKVDSTFFKEIYRDFSKPWSISFNVWNKIVINDKAYYTDYDIHDSQEMEVIEQLNQKVLIVGQNTGYDYAYHLGYPEYFFLLFLNENDEIIYESEILDIRIGDEFAMKEDFLKTRWNDKSKIFEIVLFNQFENGKNELEVHWNGNKMELK